MLITTTHDLPNVPIRVILILLREAHSPGKKLRTYMSLARRTDVEEPVLTPAGTVFVGPASDYVVSEEEDVQSTEDAALADALSRLNAYGYDTGG